jgi:hypothetical protein
MAHIGNNINKSISMPPGLWDAAEKRAASLDLTFSAYLRKLIERDLEHRGPIVIMPLTERQRKARNQGTLMEAHPESAAKALLAKLNDKPLEYRVQKKPKSE